MSAVAERRTAIFAALRALLLERPWGEVTLEAVARDAGVSRQTLYNAFGSRYGLAQAYTVHLADALCALIGSTLAAPADSPREGLEEGLRLFLETAAEDPLIDRVRAGDAHHDLVRIVTTDRQLSTPDACGDARPDRSNPTSLGVLLLPDRF